MTDEDILRNYELLKNKTLFIQCTGTPVSVQQVHLLEKYHVVPLHMVRYNRHVEEG